MNDLKDAFARSALDEPLLRTTRADILRAGRSRQRRRTVVSSIGGAAVAALVVSAVVALPRSGAGNPGAGPAAGSQPSATDKSLGMSNATGPTGGSGTKDSWPSAAGLDTVKVERTAKLIAIAADVKAQLATAGYTVTASGVDDSMMSLLAGRGEDGTETPAGRYAGKFSIRQGAKAGGVVVAAGQTVRAADVPAGCTATVPGCRVEQLPGGGTAQFRDVTDAAPGTGREVTVWKSTVTSVRFVTDSSLPISDDALLALATSPALDLSGIAPLTADQRAAVDKAFADLSVPAVKPTTDDPKLFESKTASVTGGDMASMDATKSAKLGTRVKG